MNRISDPTAFAAWSSRYSHQGPDHGLRGICMCGLRSSDSVDQTDTPTFKLSDLP